MQPCACRASSLPLRDNALGPLQSMPEADVFVVQMLMCESSDVGTGCNHFSLRIFH